MASARRGWAGAEQKLSRVSLSETLASWPLTTKNLSDLGLSVAHYEENRSAVPWRSKDIDLSKSTSWSWSIVERSDSLFGLFSLSHRFQIVFWCILIIFWLTVSSCIYPRAVHACFWYPHLSVHLPVYQIVDLHPSLYPWQCLSACHKKP